MSALRLFYKKSRSKQHKTYSDLVRERRLELPRRLTHAPQTCLSTYSSTLAYISALTHKRLIIITNLQGLSRPFVRKLWKFLFLPFVHPNASKADIIKYIILFNSWRKQCLVM